MKQISIFRRRTVGVGVGLAVCGGFGVVIPSAAVAAPALLLAAAAPIIAGVFGLWAVRESKAHDLEMKHLEARNAAALRALDNRYSRELALYQAQMQRELEVHKWRLAVRSGAFAQQLTADQEKVVNEYMTKLLLTNIDNQGSFAGTADGRLSVGRGDWVETMMPGEAEVIGVQSVREHERVAVPVQPRFQRVTDPGLQDEYMSRVRSMRSRSNPQLDLSEQEVVGTRAFSRVRAPRSGSVDREMVALRSTAKDAYGRHLLNFEMLDA